MSLKLQVCTLPNPPAQAFMQHQPLAFTLVKTVVTARDESRALSPALSTAWGLLRGELSAAHRVMSEEVSWKPEQQHDLKFVIDGVRAQFERDPRLAEEILAFLSEVDTYQDDEEAIMRAFPVLAFTGAGPFTERPLREVSNPPAEAESVEPAPESGQTEHKAAEQAPASQQVADGPTFSSSPPASSTPYWLPWLVGGTLLAIVGLTLWVTSSSASQPLNFKIYFPEVLDAPLSEPSLEAGPEQPSVLPVPHADSLRASGNYREASAALEEQLQAGGFASAKDKIAALVELAQLYSSQHAYAKAAFTELQALELSYDQAEVQALPLGRMHLRLGRYYHLAEQSVLAKAHLRQARQYFQQSQDIVAPEDLKELDDATRAASRRS